MPSMVGGAIAACLLAAALAACTGGQPRATSVPPEAATGSPWPGTAPVEAGGTASPTGHPEPSATVLPSPHLETTAQEPSIPPAAVLVADAGGPVTGALGSYTWRGGGSDSPWIVVRRRDAVRPPPPYRISLEPPLAPTAWTAAWAPIDDGVAGPIAGYAQGAGPGIVLDGPQGAGPWTLRLEASFGAAGRATWYWRLEPDP